MSAIGFDSCFYERLNYYSKALNRILLASEGKITDARDEDWTHTLQLVKSLSIDADESLRASSVAACLAVQAPNSMTWPDILSALENRKVDGRFKQWLFTLAWSLDEQRTATLTRMRHGNA
jgi:hypothetical protein